MTLLEQLAKQLAATCSGTDRGWESATERYKESWRFAAGQILTLINSHPETVERRRRDFEAGRLGDLSRGWKYDFFDDYLAADMEGEK